MLLATAAAGDQFVVAETLGFTSTPAAIAVQADGSFTAAWESFEEEASGSGFGVFAQRFNADGTPVALPFQVNTVDDREQSAPAIAVDAAGNQLIVWQSKGQDEGDTFGIYGQWYDNVGGPLGFEFKINTTTAGDQSSPAVAIDGSGKAVVAWQSYGQDGSDWGVYYTRLDAVAGGISDTTPSGDIPVNDATVGIQQNPTVAAAANGNFVIAWEAIDPLAGDDASLDIYAKAYNAAGGEITLGERLVNSDQLRDQVTPQAAIDADGDFVVVWVGGGIPGSGSDVFGQRFNELGIRAGQQFRVNDTTLASQVGGVVSMDAAGNILVAWQSVHQDGFSEGIYGRAYDAAGSILTGETLVNTVTEGPQSLPSIGMNADGRAVVTWHSKNEEHQSALFAQRFNLTTTAPFVSKVGSEFELASLVELEGSKAGAAMDHQNRTVVVFESYDEDGDAMGVYAQMLDEFGDPFEEQGPFLVNAGFTSGNQGAPAVARAPDGRFVVAWQSKDQDGDGYGIYAQRYTAAGVADGSAFRVNTTITGDQMTPAVAMGEDGRFVIVWQGADQDDDGVGSDTADGTTDIFAQRFSAEGIPVGGEFQVNQFEGTDQNMPAVTMNAAGQFAIAWVSSHPSLETEVDEEAIDTEKSIFVQWYDANGGFTGPEVIAHVYVKDAQESPQIGMDAEGHFVVAWQSINQESTDPDGGTWGVYGRQFNNQKVPLTDEEFRINEATAGLQRLVGLGVDADGNFVVAYESTAPENTDGISTDIYRREFFPDGSPNGSENVVNTWTGGPQTLPVVARAATGNYGIFWTGQGFSHIDGVHGRLYDVSLVDDPGEPSRVPVGDQFLVSTTLGFEFSSPAIAVHDNGSFTIAFETFEEDGSGFGIFTERLDASGNVIAGSRGQVNTTVLDDQSAPAIATDGSGNVLIVWQSKDASGYGIFGRWYQGGTFGAQFQLNSTLTGDQTNPDVVIDEDGRAVVAWESTGQAGGNGADVVYVTLDSIGDTTPSAEQFASNSDMLGGDQLAPRVAASARDSNPANNQFVIAWQGPGADSVDVFARRLDSNAAVNGSQFTVNSIVEKDQILPDLGMDAAGNVVFVWQSEGQTSSGSDVYTRRMTAAEGLQGSDLLVNTTTTRPQRLPSVAVDAAGNSLVAWQSQHQDGYSWGIYRQAFNAAGGRVGEEVIVNHRVEGPQTAPTVESNINGDGIVAWLGNSATHQPSVFGHLFDLPATEVAGEFLLTSYVGLEDSSPAAAMNSVRESIVVWESYAEVEDSSSGLGVFGQLLDAEGLPMGSRFLVNENIKVGNQGAPAVARAPSGEFVIAWESEVTDGSYDIFARRYLANGTPAGAIFQVNPAAVPGDQKAPTVAIGNDGRFVIAWQSVSADGSTDIMAQRYLPGGSENGTPFLVNNETDLDQFDPAISMNASGQFVISWVSNHPAADPETMEDDSEKSIFVQWFGADGQAVGDEVLVHRYVKDAQEAPAVGIDATGRFVVAWQSINQDGNSWGVFARRFNADKTPIDRREFVINETRMGPQRFAGLGVDQSGRFVIAWQSNERAELTDTGSGGGGGGGESGPEGSSWDLYSRQYSFDGSREGGELPVNTWQMGPQILPVVAQAPGGDFGIFWLGQGPDHVEGVHGRLYQNQFDFGDAPSSYGTTLVENGAQHLVGGLYLGASVDTESDGQPSANADGDGADENGVVLPATLYARVGAKISVAASAAGRLDAWIDFNRNGVFDTSERIANGLNMAAGANSFTIALPSTIVAGPTYARFRLSASGGLEPTGYAPTGEVEDYPVTLAIPAPGSIQVVDDPENPGQGLLLVKGTNYFYETITVQPTSGQPGKVTASVSPGSTVAGIALASFSRIAIFGEGGMDSITIGSAITKPSALYGDAGFDTINGGGGIDVIYGGADYDMLNGNGGNDTFVNEGGADYINGGAGSDTVVKRGSGTFTLSNYSLSVGSDYISISSIENATLIGGSGPDIFNVTGWTGGVSIEGGGGTNTLTDSADANFVLQPNSLTRTLGSVVSTIHFTEIDNVNLTGGFGNNTFDLSAWTGQAVLSGGYYGTDTVIVAGDVDYLLSDVLLQRSSMGLIRLSGFENAIITGGTAANTFNLSNWKNAASLNGMGGSDKLVMAGDANFTLNNSQLTRSVGGAIALNSIEEADLTGGTGNNVLDATGFSGQLKLSGGAGNDTLKSGAGPAILLGGTGNDLLQASIGRALMIGGSGADRLIGGGNDDLLIDGTTSYDSNAAALLALLNEWNSAGDYATRVAHLKGTLTGGLNGSYQLTSSTVQKDTSVDLLTGNAGLDWYFANLVDPNKDTLSDQSAGEIVN